MSSSGNRASVPSWFWRVQSQVQAARFDGSVDSALTIAAVVNRHVGRGLNDPEVLVVANGAGLVELRAGQWVSRDLYSDKLHVWSDEDFHDHHRPQKLTLDELRSDQTFRPACGSQRSKTEKP